MTTIAIEQAGKYEGQEVTLKGWLYNLRESGKLLFPIFRDGTGIIQGVCALKENPGAFESLKGLTQESSVIVAGKIRAEKRAPGGYEIGVTKIQIVQKVSESTPFPIQLKEHGVDFLLDQRHLWIRTPRQAAILRVRAEAIRAAREFMDGQGYTIADAPMFTPAACEGTSTLFEVNYIDDQKAYLTQSGQLYAEALAMALGKVYTFGPTFRAEKSKTRRHLTEFWMLEPEAAYVEIDEIMALGEGLVSAIVQGVLKNKPRELETLKRDTSKLENVKPPFPRISYEEAVAVLNKNGNPAKFGDDFGGDEETIISSSIRPPCAHPSLPHLHQSFLHAAGRPAPRTGPRFRHDCPGRLRRNHRRQPAHSRLRFAAEAPARTQPAGRVLPVVSRPAALRKRAAFRFRHGPGAHRRLDLRHRTHSRGDSLPSHDLPRVSLGRGSSAFFPLFPQSGI